MEYETRAGERVPAVGLGTWQMDDETAREAVGTALALGYRHVDTAQAYGNEAGVGRAIAASSVDPEDIFVTTKVEPKHRSVESIVESAAESLDRLQLETVDLLLIHWPHPLADVETVLAGLNEAADRGYTRHVGVSNYGRDRLDRARRASERPIFTDQVLFHPWWPQRDLLAYCQDTGVVLTAYSPLATGRALGDDVLAAIGERYGKSTAQVALRWVTQHDSVITIPRSTDREHLAANLDVFDFCLDADERDRVTRPSYLTTGLAMLRSQIGV
ncbi:MAG: aldo/keto reductase [Halobacteriaceae archaeon]